MKKLLFAAGALILYAVPASACTNGDEKCGPDKYILKCDNGSWRETARRCRGYTENMTRYKFAGRLQAAPAPRGSEGK